MADKVMFLHLYCFFLLANKKVNLVGLSIFF
jgi:hypothetical protein